MKREYSCTRRVLASPARIRCLVMLWALMSLTPVRAAESGPGPDLEILIAHPEESSLWDPTDALALRVELQHPAIAILSSVAVSALGLHLYPVVWSMF